MAFVTTVNARTGARRYFIDGRRVSRERQDQAKHGRRLECFLTVTHGDVIRHSCEGR